MSACSLQLLQLTLSWCGAGNVGTTTTRTECCCTSTFRAHSNKRPQSVQVSLQLHWLPVRSRIVYKLFCIMHSVHTGKCPAYLKNTVQPAAARQSRSDLRSSTSAYLLPRLKTKFRERAFSHAGPSAWNALPIHIRDVPSPNSFRKL